MSACRLPAVFDHNASDTISGHGSNGHVEPAQTHTHTHSSCLLSDWSFGCKLTLFFPLSLPPSFLPFPFLLSHICIPLFSVPPLPCDAFGFFVHLFNIWHIPSSLSQTSSSLVCMHFKFSTFCALLIHFPIFCFSFFFAWFSLPHSFVFNSFPLHFVPFLLPPPLPPASPVAAPLPPSCCSGSATPGQCLSSCCMSRLYQVSLPPRTLAHTRTLSLTHG